MNNVIWKYSLGPTPNHTLSMPKGAEVIQADIQHGEFFIWAIIPDTEAEKENRFFLIAATGGPEDSRTTKESHISTIMDGDYVWHVFEVRHE